MLWKAKTNIIVDYVGGSFKNNYSKTNTERKIWFYQFWNCSEFCDERGRLDAEYWSWFVLQWITNSNNKFFSVSAIRIV
jgi:hypothetical protein